MNVSCFTCVEFPLSWFLLLSLNTRSCGHIHTIKHRSNLSEIWKNTQAHAVCPVQIPGQHYVIFIDLVSWTNIGSSEKETKLWCLVLQSNWKAHTEPTRTHTSSWQFFLFLPVIFWTFFPSGMLDMGGETGVSSLPPLLCGQKKNLMDKSMFPQALINNWLVNWDLLLHLPEKSVTVETPQAPVGAASPLFCSWPLTPGSPPVCSPSLLPLFSDTPPADAPVLTQTHS